ncbi:MAG: hypothetical protein RLZ68_452 [Pseudomonadota bacterium]|jgi:hypothetical protein
MNISTIVLACDFGVTYACQLDEVIFLKRPCARCSAKNSLKPHNTHAGTATSRINVALENMVIHSFNLRGESSLQI